MTERYEATLNSIRKSCVLRQTTLSEISRPNNSGSDIVPRRQRRANRSQVRRDRGADVLAQDEGGSGRKIDQTVRSRREGNSHHRTRRLEQHREHGPYCHDAQNGSQRVWRERGQPLLDEDRRLDVGDSRFDKRESQEKKPETDENLSDPVR